jgi:hypothetical protein
VRGDDFCNFFSTMLSPKEDTDMRRLFLALVAAATASAGSLANRADAMTLSAPAAVRAAVENIPVTEPVHCRSYVHWHQWGYGYGCGPGVVPYAVAPVVVAPPLVGGPVVVAPRRAVVVAPRRAVVVAPRRAVVVAPRRVYGY